MRIVLTGGAGFIGSHVAYALVESGHEVAVIDDLSSGKKENLPKEVNLVVADIRSKTAKECIINFLPEVLVHHAAQIDVRRSVSDPCQDADINIIGSINLMEACSIAGTRRILFASTGGAIYGEQESFPATEVHPRRPTSPYGCAKAAVEFYLDYYAHLRGISWIALRYANVYGPRQDPHGEAGVVAIFSNRLLEGQPCTVYGDGLQTRDYVYVDDVVEANLLALESEHSGAVNIGTGVETDVNTLYRYLADAAGEKVSPLYADPRPGEQKRSCIDPSLAKAVLGWSPKVELSSGTVHTFQYFRDKAASSISSNF